MEEKNEKKIKRKRIKRKYSLPETRLSFEKELDVLKALVEFSQKGEKPILWQDIQGIGTQTYMSSELSFFADAGLAIKEKGSKYLPTSEVIEIVNNLEWSDEKTAKNILKKVLSRSWFGELVIKILSVVKEKSLDEIIKELGKTAEANPEKDEKAIKRLVKWLKYAEIIDIDENNIVHIKDVPTSKKEEDLPPDKKTESMPEMTTEKEMMKTEEIKNIQKEILLNLTINLQIDSTSDIEKFREIIRIIKKDLVEDNDA